MKTYIKYITKHLTSFVIFLFLLSLINISSFILTFYKIISTDYGGISPNKFLPVVARNSSIDGTSDEIATTLYANEIWAMLLNSSGEIQWSVNLPPEIPDSYTLQDVALFSKGYLNDYPVFVWNSDDGLIVLGYPKGSYMKLTSNYFSLEAIQTFPVYILLLILADIFMILFAYALSKKRIIKNMEPILSSIETLASGKSPTINISGELSEIATSINNASFIISKQNEARANWISGVSHDIRTPLSIIIGYADRISLDTSANNKLKEQANIIKKQSLQIKELVADLNLVSKLEYDMQPIEVKPFRISKLLRSYVADTLNEGLSDIYHLNLIISSAYESQILNGDTRLIMRAINNLVSNSIKHNADGCNITIELKCTPYEVQLIIKDDGIGISPEKREEIKKPHYMEALDERLDLRHGLGLLLVKRIVKVHNGYMELPNVSIGFTTILHFPIA